MTNEKPRAFTTGLRQMIQRDLNNAPSREDQDRILDWYDKKIEEFSAMFAPVKDPITRAAALHFGVDNAIEMAVKKDPEGFSKVTCKKGCAHCCHSVIAITQDEAELLIKHAKNISWEIDWYKVEKQEWYAKDQSRYFKLLPENNACVFLGTDNTCQVYEHRPASCRKYFAVSNPEDCSPATKVPGGKVLNWGTQHSELIVSGAFDMNHSRNGTMQEMLLKAKKEKNI